MGIWYYFYTIYGKTKNSKPKTKSPHNPESRTKKTLIINNGFIAFFYCWQC
jgi:hypothetical protein